MHIYCRTYKVRPTNLICCAPSDPGSVARLFRGGGLRRVARKNPASKEAGYRKPLSARGAFGAQMRKQFRLREFLLRAVSQTLHRHNSSGEFVIAQDHSMPRFQAI